MSYHTNASSATSLCYQLQTFKNALRFIKEKTIFALAVGLFAFNANAAIIIRIQPSASGTEVIATASGSHTIQTPKDVGQTFNNPAWIIPAAGIVNFVSAVSAPGPILARITVPDMTCTGTMGSGGINAANAVSVTGDEFGFSGGNLLVPPLKTVGDVVYTTGTMTFTGTLASLGFTAGTRSCTWGSGTQSLTITVLTSPAPTVTSLSPNNGPAAGGTSVTITGTDLTGATAVTIGGVAATNVTVVNATTITATTPAHASGAASVVVTTPGGAMPQIRSSPTHHC